VLRDKNSDSLITHKFEVMIATIQKRFALSAKGAKDFSWGVFFSSILNIALMFPAVYIFLFLEDYLLPIIGMSEKAQHGFWYYLILGVGFMIFMFLIAMLQYSSTYTKIYNESANRRISLAEKLRKLPLAFFGEKNLSDLTSTIMNDSTELETTFSHTVPPQLSAWF